MKTISNLNRESTFGVFSLLCAVFLTHAATRCVQGADIQADVSTRETYVGLPIVLRISINNAAEHEIPQFPKVPGLEIKQAGPPSRSSQSSWINGRRSQRTTITYPYLVTPSSEGVFTIPPIKVIADGVANMTKAVRVVATKSETGDLLFVEISGSKKKIFVGESLDLTLRLWIRPYQNSDYRIALNEEEMWYCLSERTSWGIFQDRMEELAEQRKRPGGKRVLREDSEKSPREYILYEIKTTIYPDRPTAIDGQDTRVIVNYPVSLGRSRSPLDIFSGGDFFSGTPFGNSSAGSFGGRVSVTKSRPLIAETSTVPIEVLAVPEQGKPNSYVGAVGQYSIKATASPTEVAVGDPITLELQIRGDGLMDVLRAPPIHQQVNLTEDFKVTDESLAGIVNSSSKTFTTSIRPLREGVAEIPGIQYSYFDPDQQKYISINTDPIPITVKRAEVLALNAATAGSQTYTPEPSSDATSADTKGPSGKDYLFRDSQELNTARVPRAWPSPILILIAFPPFVVLVTASFRHRGLVQHLLSPRRRFTMAIANSNTASEIIQAFETYLVQKFALTVETNPRSYALGSLRAFGHHPIAIQAERLFQSDSGGSVLSIDQLKKESTAVVNEIERQPKPKHSKHSRLLERKKLSPLFLAVSLSAALSCQSTQAASEQPLSESQQKAILAEALSAYDRGLSLGDSEEATREFQAAANSFASLISSGPGSDKLYFNLAQARRRSKRLGPAIAAYRQALAINPNENLYLQQLRFTESQNAATPGELTNLQALPLHQVTRWTPPHTLRSLFAITWLVTWGLILARLFVVVPAFKTTIGLMALLAVTSGTLYAAHISHYQGDNAVILVKPNIQLREGDGEQFPERSDINLVEGSRLTLNQTRGDWLRVTTSQDQSGWIKNDDAILIQAVQ